MESCRRSRKRIPWHRRDVYRRITAFMLMFVMVFSNMGSSVYTAYGAVAKEKVKVHAQISSEAIIDTLIATGGAGIDFDDEIADLLLAQAQSEYSSQAVYDQLMEELAKEDRHLIAQRKVGNLGLFLIAENETEETVYPDSADFDAETVSEEVFKLYSKGRLINKDGIIDESEDEEDFEEESEEPESGGTAAERQAVADSISRIFLATINLADDITYDVTVSLTDDSLTVIKAELVTSVYKEKKETDKQETPVKDADQGNQGGSVNPAPEETTASPTEESTEAPTEETEEPSAEAPTETPTEAPTPIETPTEAPTEPSAEEIGGTETEAPTEAATAAPADAPTEASTETPTEASTEAETEAPTEAPGQVPTEAETEAPTVENTEAPTEAPAEVPAEAPVEVPAEVPAEVSIEKVETPVLQTALDAGVESTEDNNTKEESSVTVITKETAASEETTTPETAAPDTTAAPEETTGATETTEALEKMETPETTATPEESTAAPENTDEGVKENDDEGIVADQEEDESEEDFTVKNSRTELKKSDLESLAATDKKASSSEVKGGFKFTVKPYAFAMLAMDMEAGEVEAKAGTLRIENSTENPVFYSVKLSSSESEELVLYNGAVIYRSLEDEQQISEGEIFEGELALSAGEAVEIENLPADTKYEVEIIPREMPQLFSISLMAEEHASISDSSEEISEGAVFENGSTFAAGTVGSGTRLATLVPKSGELLVTLVDYDDTPITDFKFVLKRSTGANDEVGQELVSGNTNSNGQAILKYNNGNSGKYYYYLFAEHEAETVQIAKYQRYSSTSSYVNLRAVNKEAGYEIATNLSVNSGRTDKPAIELKRKQAKLTITPTIQGTQTAAEFSYVIAHKDGTPYTGQALIDGNRTTVTDGVLVLRAGESAVIDDVRSVMTIVAQKVPGYTVNRIVEKGALVSTSNKIMEYRGTDIVNIAYSYRASDASAGGTEVTKKAILTDTPGLYDVTLTVSGQPTRLEQATNVDVLLVIDLSGSMADNMSGGSSRPSRYSILKTAVEAMADNILGTSGNRIRAVGYSTSSTDITDGWVTKRNELIDALNSKSPRGRTNCMAGFEMANSVLSDLKNDSSRADSQKFVVYLSDGEANEPGNQAVRLAVNAAKQLRQNHPDVTIMTLGVSNSPGTSVLAPTGEDKYWDNYAVANDEKAFKDAFKTITDIIEEKYQYPMVTDVMGSNVNFVAGSMQQPIVKENGMTSQEGTASYDAGTDTINWDVITSSPDELKTYDKVYSLSYQVQVDKINLPYEGKGESGTGTHDGQDGWWSNTKAELYCNNSITFPTNVFPRPVVQLAASSSLHLQKIADGSTLQVLPGAEFELLKKDIFGEWTDVVKAGTTGAEGTLELTGLSTDIVYQLKETKAPAGYVSNNSVLYIKAIVESDGRTVNVYLCSEEGVIASDARPITESVPLQIINQRESVRLNLSVTKKIDNGAGLSDEDKVFTFKLSGPEGNEAAAYQGTIQVSGNLTESSDIQWETPAPDLEHLKPGVYTIEEIGSNPYFTFESASFAGTDTNPELRDGKIIFTVGNDNSSDQSLAVIFVNKRIVKDITVTKKVTINNQPTTGTLADGTYYFALYNSDGTARIEGQPVREITIRNGQASTVTFTGVPIGSYKIYEGTLDADNNFTKGAPAGMAVVPENGAAVAVTASSAGLTAEFTNNKAVSGEVTLNKTDGAGNVLENAEFTLYKKSGDEYEKVINGVYRTDINGDLKISDLPFGEYRLVETKAPAGYELTDPAWSAEFIISDRNGQQIYSFDVTNNKIQGYAQITKVFSDEASLSEEEKAALLRQVSIGVYDARNDEVVVAPQYLTGKTLIVGPLDEGSYYFKETAAPSGYLVSSEKAAFEIKASTTENTPVTAGTITNVKVSASVEFTKVDKDNNGSPMQGVEFKLYEDGNAVALGTYTSDVNGLVRVEGLGAGTYYFTEVTPKGYEENTVKYYFTIARNDHGTTVAVRMGSTAGEIVTSVENKRKTGSVTAVKADAETKEPLAGAEFMLYARKTESSTFAAKAVNFVKNLFANDDGFELYWDQPYAVAADGTLSITGLPWNDYKLVETKAPQGYKLLDTPLAFTVDADHLEISLGIDGLILNERQTGSVKLTKSGKEVVLLDGAVFELYRKAETADGADEKIGTTYTTEKGIITVTNLTWGTYYFKETGAPAGYLLPQGDDAKTAEFTIGPENADEANVMVQQTLEKKNELIEGNLLLNKQFDGKTAETAGISPEDLAKVTFDVYRQQGDTPDTEKDVKVNGDQPLQLRADGTMEYGPLTEGRYYVVETGAPDSYPISSEKYFFEITADNYIAVQIVTVDNTSIKRNAAFTKADLDNHNAPIKDAVFALYKLDTEGSSILYRDNIHTNEAGLAEVNGLGVGTYYFVETSNTGYAVPDTKYYFTITRDTGDAIELHLNSADGPVVSGAVVPNNRLTASVELTKQDRENAGKLAGAQFSLYRRGTDHDILIGEKLTTDADGKLVYGGLEDGLTWGDYYFVETKAPEGYELDSTPREFTVDRNTFSGGRLTVEITVQNDRYYGAASLTKEFKDVAGDILKNHGLSAQFDLYKKGEDGDTKINVNPLVTDRAGKITVDNLATGSYYFVETKAPEGYKTELEADGSQKKYEFTITVPEDNAKVTVDAGVSVNQQKPGEVEVEKLGGFNGSEVMAGVSFEVYKDGLLLDELIGTIVTKEDGKASMGGLEWGDYYLKEVTPEGYVTNNQQYKFTISADQLYKGFTGSAAVVNTMITGSVMLTKSDAETKDALQGVKFDLYKGVYDSGIKVNTSELVTDANGQIKVEGLKFGDYYFLETEAKTGYELYGEPIVFSIREHEAVVTVAPENIRRKGSIEITKEDSESHAKLTGAEFTLYSKTNHKSTNAVMQMISSLFNGDNYYEYGKYTVTGDMLKIDNLPWDEYYLEETKAPQGYVLDQAIKYPFVIDAEHLTGTLASEGNAITNTRQTGSLTLVKTDAADDNEKLAGAEFELYLVGADGRDVKQEGTFVTGTDGTVTVDGLAWGTYYFKEIKAPEGYDIPADPNSTRATIDAANANEQNVMVSQMTSMTNTRIRGAAELTKKFKDGSSVIDDPDILAALYADVVFSLYKGTAAEDNPVLINDNVTLNADGKAVIENLEYGSYFFLETASPAEYPVNTVKHAFTISESSTTDKPVVAAVQVDNAKVYSSAQIVKVDGDDNSRPIAGAVFGLYNAADSSKLSEITSDEYGVVRASGLGVGTYYLQEISNTGYEVSEEMYFFEITKESGSEVTVHKGSLSGDVITQVVNKRQSGSITIVKKGNDTANGLDGAKFALYTASDRTNPVNELTTVNGKVTFDGLAWGTYYVVETEAPFGYVLAEKLEDRTYEFIVNRENIILTKEIVNTRIKGSVRLTKEDAKDSQTKLSGAEFALYREDGTLKAEGLVTVNGEVRVQNLDAGNYYFVETKAPAGYTIQMENGQPKKYRFTINQASITVPAAVSVADDRIPGSVLIFKVDSETGAGLEGAVFELRSVNTGLKSLLRQTEVIGQYKTDGKGRLEIENLEWGIYELQEMEAPTGYVITDGSPIRFEINADHLQHGTEAGTDRIEVENTRQTGSLQLIKKDQEGNAVEGAEFELYRRNTETADSDTKIPNGETGNGNYVTDRAGIITVTGLSWGTYYFKEVSAPTGYAIDSAVTGDVTINAATVEDSKTKPLIIEASNTKIYGSVILYKVGENGEALTGAEFDLYSYTKAADGGITNPVKMGSYAVSSEAGKEGSLTVEGLPYGDYYFVETKAPSDYNLSQVKAVFSITENGKRVELNYENTKIRAAVRFQKVDSTGSETVGLNGAVFELYKKSGSGAALQGEYTSRTIDGSHGVVYAKGLGAGEYYFIEKTPPVGYEPNTGARYEFTVTAEDNDTVIDLDPVVNTRKSGSVMLTKYAADLELTLSGAVYNLYQMAGAAPAEASDRLIAEGLVTDADGVIRADSLAWGNYYFVEQTAPAGYEKDETPIQFTITAETDFTKAVAVRGENTRIPGSLSIEKVSSEDHTEKLSGVTFELKLQGEDVVAATLITDAEGKASAENLAWGTYTLTEIKTADGFLLWGTEDSRTITIDADHLAVSLTGDQAVTNAPVKGSVRVIKKDAEDDNNLLADAAFDVYRAADNTKIGSLKTGPDGTAVFGNLRYGEYYLVETEAPQGYVLPDETAAANRIPFIIKDHGEVVEVPVTDARVPGSVTAVKTDETGYALEGAVFTLYSRTNHKNSGFAETLKARLTGTYYEYGTYTTGQDGIVRFVNLPWDEYYLEETKAPVGYELNSTQYEFVIDRNHLEAVVGEDGQIKNDPLKGSVKLTKTDEADGGLLAGAVFELYQRLGSEGQKLEIDAAALTTGEDGTLTISGLEWGTYYFKEVKAPDGYALNPNEAEFTITRENVAQSIEVPLAVGVTDKALNVRVDKVDAETRESLGGAELKLYRLEDIEAGKPAEGAVPIAEWSSKKGVPNHIGRLLSVGSSYVLIETKAPAGYTLAENLIFTVNADGTIETDGVVTEDNIILVQDVKFIPGTLEVTAGKKLTGRTLKEGEFTFNLLDEQKNTVASAANREDGSIVFNLENFYTETGEYDYTIVEADNGLSGVTYDKNEYALHVSVTDNNEGGLAVKVTYPNDSDGIVFMNTYRASGSLTVAGTKQMNGREFKAGDEFTFELLRDQKVVDTAVIKPESGNRAAFTLQDNSLDETDARMTYTYEVREVTGGQTVNGVTYDNRIYKAEYKVEDNGDGTVTANMVSGDALDRVTFTNVYRTGGAAFAVSGNKHMAGRNFRSGDEFTFIAEKDGQPYDTVTIRPESGRDQAFSFKADNYTMEDAGKTYVYTVWEEKGTLTRVTYSTAVYKIFVSITDDGNGGLNVTAVANESAFTSAEFVNTYRDSSGGGDTPGGNTPDPNDPFVPGGPGDPTITIEPGDVPLVNLPSGQSDDLILIDDGNVPLAGLPKTGDRAGAYAGLAAMLSGFFLAAFAALSRKREENK